MQISEKLGIFMKMLERTGDWMKKRMRILAGALIAVILGAVWVYGAFSDKIEVINHISVGDINISITEYAQKGTGEVLYKTPENIVPGQKISKIPRITNYALPCWIRAKIVCDSDSETLEGLSEQNILGISEDWIKRGEYYYYTKILKKQASVDLFQQVVIPESWTEEHADQDLKVEIQADAIQAANFTPDFSAASPWGDQEIQLCIHEEDGTLTCRKGETELSVEYRGDAHRLVAVPSDFFTNLNTAMPGDVLNDTVYLSNTTEETAELFFWTDTDGRTEAELKMLNEIPFRIMLGEKELYTGTLDAADIDSPQSLGSFEPGEEGKLNFELRIPKEWDNSYALTKTDVTWIFAVEEKTESETKENSLQKTDNDADQKETSVSQNPVKTGDSSNPAVMVLLLVGTGMIILVSIFVKGGKKT